ncbi:MAG: exodeoxyribonuclease VII small subunit [Muribaculaceae bacterium]|nr:exodeoxyribonuclease VII small subunit [Muribaculaceae bacterium]
MDEQLSYGKAIAELETIVAKMQSDECDIDSLAGYTTRALELLKFCKEKLFVTDQEVKKCLEALNQ